MSMKDEFIAIVDRYRSHPEFLGIDIIDPNQPGAMDDTLLHVAARTGAVDDIKVLTACGATVNLAGDLGNTPLHQAAMRGQLDAVKLLLRLGASDKERNEFGQTALDVALIGGHREVADVLKTRLSGEDA
jgi:ankyrin repeat protein